MKSIHKIVKSLIHKHGTSCPFKISKEMGVQVQFEYLGDKIMGYYSKHFRIPIIHINETVEEPKQLFTCAHELGHFILHPNSNTPFLKKHTLFSTDHIEIEANTFAIELLFSSEDNPISKLEAIELYGIPKQLLISLGR